MGAVRKYFKGAGKDFFPGGVGLPENWFIRFND
jgi:hypothetical protein